MNASERTSFRHFPGKGELMQHIPLRLVLWAALFSIPTPHPQIHVEALTHCIQMTTAPRGRRNRRVTSRVAERARRDQGAASVWDQRKFEEDVIIELAPQG